ncbi:MAG: hypothetical protein H6Q57_531 [Geobacteraceae bacterium]|nr:hypothetical protein [Geobacteraceae bacterium]
MGRILFLSLLLVIVLCSICHAGTPVFETSSGQQQAAKDQALELQGKVINDNDVMGLIAALQNDPEVRALLDDPDAMNAVLSMDMNFIENDPRFKKLRDNPHMRKILKLMNQ